MWTAWASLGMLAAPSPWAVEEAVIVDRIVAVVGERLVLASDLRLEEALKEIDPSPVVLLRSSGDPLQDAIDRAIIRGLAGSTAVYSPTALEVRARGERIRSKFKDEPSWQRFLDLHGLDSDRLAGMLYSRLVTERYVLRNVEQSARTEDPVAYYLEWMSQHRARVAIRLVPENDRMVDP